ncbi:hypothetical protein OIU76_014131 [Salix suchowensis]|uniref:SERINE/THREONINE-PROTEIN KINASE FRAY2 n=3 Tax=Salix TaxID=40685 RepID=A0A9Q0WNY6_9ROSI|nr:hypothetical protein OIU76_014131 [Salix suchowensis]KAJ6351356.1 hypothetical protein OIU78_007297 [Salix suchowensis]KAJ6769090.1 SERINE/THREONINE-PROTEIN KINASE FRAY2 [Salix koriyanagi]
MDQISKFQRVQYPLDSNAYKILDEIGVGVSATVYKAICVPMNSTLVAIKCIDLDQSRSDLDSIRRETKTMSLLSHPNILESHCSFTVDRHLWMVMPFMSAGSLQSIISSSFPDGLPEPCIAVVLKEILNALSYLHDQGHIHRDVKAGNILIDSNGKVKLADFGVSASIYELNTLERSSSLSSSSRMRLTDLAGTPYWMAPEVIHSHTGYSLKADIWSFGITALELAHGRPPLSHLPPSKSLIMKITKRFRFSDCHDENHKKNRKNKKFSKAFKAMVASCLDQDPSKRPSAAKLLKNSVFKNCKGMDYFVKNVLNGLPSVEERFKEYKVLSRISSHSGTDAEEEEGGDVYGDTVIQHVKTRRISGWNFNEEGFELDPVFPTDSNNDAAVKQVRFGGESIIQDKKIEVSESYGSGDLADSAKSSTLNSPAPAKEEMRQVGDHIGVNTSGVGGIVGRLNQSTMLEGLVALKRSLEEQRRHVAIIIGLLGGETNGEEQMIENLKEELDIEKQKNLKLEMEMEFLKIAISGASAAASFPN